MAHLSVTVALAVVLSLLAVTHSRLVDPTAAVAVPDEPKPTAESDEAGPTEQLVVVPAHRLANPDFLREVGFALRLPSHRHGRFHHRHHPCRHGHGLGHRWWADRHHLHGLNRVAVPVEWATEGEEAPHHMEAAAERVSEPDPDSDSDWEGEHDDDEEQEEMEKRWKKEMNRRFGHGRRHHHHHDEEENHGEEEEEDEGGVMKWFRDLIDRF